MAASRIHHVVHAAQLALAICLAAAAPAAAQQADPALSSEPQPVGWSVTPRVGTSLAWDDNVLVQGTGDRLGRDLNTSLDGAASLDYLGKVGAFSAAYNGSMQMYRDLSSLNNYMQALNVSARRRITPQTMLFAQQSFSRSPTTELSEFVGIPFQRIGARIADIRGGVESSVTKRFSYAASYNFQWIDFDDDPRLGFSLFGGRAHGGSLGLRYQRTPRLAFTGDAVMQRASVVNDTTFAIFNSWGGVDYQLSDLTRVYGGAGLARMGAADLGPGKTSPVYRAGIAHRFEVATVDANYSRSFQPSYGGGGTLDNEEFAVNANAPIGGRMYVNGNVSWRRNKTLGIFTPALTSLWMGGTFGYAIERWVRIEAFYSGTHQRIDRPGGQMDRNRIGIQVVTVKPVRID